MELPLAGKPSSPLLPFQSDRKILASRSRISTFSATPFPNPCSVPSVLSFTSFDTPKAGTAPTNSLHRRNSTQCSTHSIGKFSARSRILSKKISCPDGGSGAKFLHFLGDHLSKLTCSPLLMRYLKIQLKVFAISVLSVPLPSFASETEEVSGKINIEDIVVSIDNFFNRYPFFVAGVTFIWLVVIPLTQEYLKKYKYITVVDAFRKLGEDANSQLLDVRKKQSLAYLESPNLKILNKRVVQVEFSEGREGDFVEEVLRNFQDPSSTVLCVLDNFDGDSLKIAELLFKSGFKGAYAIKGGVRGKEGWQAVQETLLPPSLHVYPRKKKSLRKINKSERMDRQYHNDNIEQQDSIQNRQNVNNGGKAASGTEDTATCSLSPYPNYPDLKPPSSPTPLKPL